MEPVQAPSGPPTTAAAKSGPNSSPQPPPGYKFIKIKYPDGRIVTAKKKLTPEELEKQPQSHPPTNTPKTDNAASKTDEAPKTTDVDTAISPKPNGAAPALVPSPAAAPSTLEANEGEIVGYEILSIRMPDGTLKKARRPIRKSAVAVADAADKSARDAPATTPAPVKTDEAAPAKDTKYTKADDEADAPDATERSLTAEEKEALAEQALQNKHHRRSRFKNALLFGLIGASETVIPDLLDGDEILDDTDLSDDDDYDDKRADDDKDGHEDPEGEKTGSNVAPAVAAAATSAAAGVAVAALAGGPPQQPQPPPPTRQPPGNQPNDAGVKAQEANGKQGYRVTVKDLKDLDEKAEEREGSQKTLERRWAAFSFYFMASLSVILPLLFLILTIFIIVMNGKSVDGNWGHMVDAIRWAITIWPIVFAAVTAQAFKTWAAYKVERGVKLMELEQLVGSNSFGAVMKQPFLLRRLDLLTVGIFLIWALSPIGSQALQRSYSLGHGIVNDTVEVKYVPLLGPNTLLSPGAEQRLPDGIVMGDLYQIVATYYMSIFLPDNIHRSRDDNVLGQDWYNHPIPSVNLTGEGWAQVLYTSNFGVPLVLPDSKVGELQREADSLEYQKGKSTEQLEKDKQKQKAKAGVSTPIEEIRFPITSSFFTLKCNPWQNVTYGEMLKDTDLWAMSTSGTLGMTMSGGGPEKNDINRLRYATLRNHGKWMKGVTMTNLSSPEVDWTYSMIDCSLKQVFYNSTVLCSAQVGSGKYYFDCRTSYDETVALPDDQIRPEWRMPLKDFSYDFVMSGSPYPLLAPYTPTERYAFSASAVDATAQDMDQISDFGPNMFEANFGMLLNSWITISHCTECISTYFIFEIIPDPAYGTYEPKVRPEHLKLYQSPTIPAKRGYSPISLVYKLDWRWIGVLLASVIVLLIIGIISVILEGMLLAPDVLGYASTLARNSRYLHLPKTAAKPMSGPERARAIGSVKVMIQDVKPDKDVGKIALGLKHDRAEPLKPGRLYR